MEKKYYALKLIPRRQDFASTMSPEERSVMQKHAAYWKDFMNKGYVVVFGPVLDPAAVYGLGILSVDDESQVKDFILNDPASTINQYEYFPMMAVVPNQPVEG